MRDQRGFTITELLAAGVIFALIWGMAYLSGINFVVSARVSKASSGVADSISVARSLAIAKSQPTQLRFVTNAGGTTDSYELRSWVYQSCVPKWDDPCSTGYWDRQEEFEPKEFDPDVRPDRLPKGTLIYFPGKSGELTITFDPSGRRSATDNVAIELDVCAALKSGSVETCRPGYIRRLCVKPGSGVIGLLKEGETCQ